MPPRRLPSCSARRSWRLQLGQQGGERVRGAAGSHRQRRPGPGQAADLELAAVHGRRLRRGLQTATGLVVDYKEDFNDNEEWFAKNKALSRKQNIGADLVVPTQFMAARLAGLG